MLEVITPSGRWDRFCAQILDFLRADRITLPIDGQSVRGFRSPDSPALWIRDHADMLRGGRFIEPDVRSAVSCFAWAQAANGRVYDHVVIPGGDPEDVCERENWEKWVRVPVEADVEYRFVKAGYLAWQATGDEDWLRETLPALDRALTYTRTHPHRWSEEHGLVKRAYTIDTWDFDYTAGRAPWLHFAITDDTFWGIFHGDCSGYYEACRLLARLYWTVGDAQSAARWEDTAAGVRERANALLFNGRFYTHFHKITPVDVPGVDEAEQLSLSTPMAINRGLATHEIAVGILQEYRRRRETTEAFAEWFGIDPPFPDGVFGDEKLVGGAYINGGIFPLTGGELARAAFAHGFEGYGLETLDQYRRMIERDEATYLWYFPDGTASTAETSTSPDALPTDGWGSSAMLYAFVEGLCGIEDQSHSYRRVALAPRWAATDETDVEVRLAYAASEAGFGYAFRHDTDARTLRLDVEGDAEAIALHVLVPDGTHPTAVRVDGRRVDFATIAVGDSRYADAGLGPTTTAQIEVVYADA